MKKNVLKIAIATLCTAFAFATAAGALAQNKTVYVSADVATTQTDTLVAPAFYEQYLPLNTPTDVAVSERYTAIADANVLYVYDRKDGEYQEYKHGADGVSESHIKKLQFDEYGTLYFLDGSTSTNFYSFDVETGEKTRLDLACGTFAVDGRDLYFTNAQEELYYVSLDAAPLAPTSLQWNTVSSLAFWNEELYFIHSDFYLMKIDPKTQTLPDPSKARTKTFSKPVQSIAVGAGTFTCTDTSGSFFVYPLPCRDETQPLFTSENGGFTSLALFGEHVYAVQTDKGVIKQYSTAETGFTDYEICDASSSPNRLDGASELYLYKSNLFIADNANQRICVYDTTENALKTTFRSTLSPSFLSADEDALLVANTTSALLYSLEEQTFGTLLAEFDDFEGNIIGVASVYGKHYLATDTNYFYLLSPNEKGEYMQTEIKKTSTRYPTQLTSDAHGNLYICSGNSVYAFTETQFTSPEQAGTEITDALSAQTQKIAVDYKRNVYAQAGNVIHKIGGEGTDFSTPIVYTTTTQLTSFAFGIEENQAYLLFDGNYVVATARLNLPTVKTIPVNGADEDVFSAQSAAPVVVETQENTLLIAFDVAALQGANVFPYLSYHRAQARHTALQIGISGDYLLLALFDERKNAYQTYLTRAEFCTALDENEYSKEYTPQEQTTAYITNDVQLYKFPYLTTLLTVDSLPRGGQVLLLGEITKLDHDYYRVSYTDEQGILKTGYIPKTYALAFDGTPLDSEEYTAGDAQSNRDALWRLAYLILGFGAICILADYLLLKGKHD